MRYRFTKDDAYKAWNRDPADAAHRAVKDACRSEAPEVLPKLKALINDPNPKTSILAMEAILRLAYGKPSVARQVRQEVHRLTGRSIPYTTIRQWPDGKLKDIGSPESVELLDVSLRDETSRQQLEARRVELERMELELVQAAADLREMEHTVQLARHEVEALEAIPKSPLE
jgi:hypothetical protein